MKNEYDLAEAFRRIENELMASMIRNMDRHRAEETEEGYNWSMWQVEQLKALERYKRNNQKKYQKQFRSINAEIEELIWMSREKGKMNQEILILKNIRRGYRFPDVPDEVYDLLEKMEGRSFKEKASLLLDFIKGKKTSRLSGEFFKLNDRKMEALIKATMEDMEKAETAVLRKANDDYRKVIYNAQVYANTGAGTYEKAVDMATKDMLSRGLNCVMYANGARHTLSDYADMAIRTASKRAYLQGEGEKRQEWGVTTVIMAKRGNPCPKCLPFVGKVLIDDVWSGGRSDGVDPETGKRYPLMSYAISKGLYHPRCKDSHTTYFPGISTADDTWTKDELENVGFHAKQEARQQYAQRQAEKYDRLSQYSLDQANTKEYSRKAAEWEKVTDDTEQKKEKLLSIPKEITDEWTKKVKNGQIVDLEEYSVGETTYKVDGKKILLDYSDHERKVAENIAKLYGKSVQMVPRVTYPQGVSTPDFQIDGIGWDLKTVSTAGKNVLYNAVKKKKKQAGCFIFDISECPLELDEIKKQVNDLFRSTHLTFIDRIGLYKDGRMLGVYERDKK